MVEVQVPDDINPRLWKTFHRELVGRVGQLQECLARAEQGDTSDDLMHRLARTLHTIKSAAMVIPSDPITHCTHATESLLAAARETHQEWPEAAFREYVGWLDSLVTEPEDINEALSAGDALKESLDADPTAV